MATEQSNRAAFVELALRGYVGFVRLLGSGKSADRLVSATNSNLRRPDAPGLVPSCANQSCLVLSGGTAQVLQVGAPRNITQIDGAIVRLKPVDVVNVIGRPTSMNVEPSKPVRVIPHATYADDGVPNFLSGASSRPNRGAKAQAFKPRKHTSLWVVMEKFAQTLRGKIGLSHDALLMLIGQRPARVDSACGLRYFNVGGA